MIFSWGSFVLPKPKSTGKCHGGWNFKGNDAAVSESPTSARSSPGKFIRKGRLELCKLHGPVGALLPKAEITLRVSGQHTPIRDHH